MRNETKRDILRSFKKIECPKCRAKIGTNCRNKLGRFRIKPHLKRTRAYYEVDKLAKGQYLSLVLKDLIQRVKTLEHANFIEEEYLVK